MQKLVNFFKAVAYVVQAVWNAPSNQDKGSNVVPFKKVRKP